MPKPEADAEAQAEADAKAKADAEAKAKAEQQAAEDAAKAQAAERTPEGGRGDADRFGRKGQARSQTQGRRAGVKGRPLTSRRQ